MESAAFERCLRCSHLEARCRLFSSERCRRCLLVQTDAIHYEQGYE
jgi:hypothetical protein